MISKLKSIFILILVAFTSANAFAVDKSTAKPLFHEANEHYSQGQYTKAIEKYREILEYDYEAFKVYYNLGNAYYKTDQIPKSILYYEKANKLKPNNKDLKHNLKLAKLNIVDKVDEAPSFFLKEWWRSLFLFQSIRSWGAIFIILFFLTAFLLSLYFFSHRSKVKKLSFFLAIAIMALALFSLSMAYTQKRYLEANESAIVFSPAVTVKSGPSADSNKLFVIHEGLKVNILSEEENWYKIELMNGKVGWLKKGDVELI